jgi:hypothetical protein
VDDGARDWQSEFLQLLSSVLTAVFIQKGRSESDDSGETMGASPRRIEARLGTFLGDLKCQGQDLAAFGDTARRVTTQEDVP